MNIVELCVNIKLWMLLITEQQLGVWNKWLLTRLQSSMVFLWIKVLCNKKKTNAITHLIFSQKNYLLSSLYWSRKASSSLNWAFNLFGKSVTRTLVFTTHWFCCSPQPLFHIIIYSKIRSITYISYSRSVPFSNDKETILYLILAAYLYYSMSMHYVKLSVCVCVCVCVCVHVCMCEWRRGACGCMICMIHGQY